MVEVVTTVDRVALSSESKTRVESWLDVVSRRLEGMVKVTKSDLVNAILMAHGHGLSDEEIFAIGRECFDEVRWLNWAMERLKQAKKDGSTLTMADLLKSRNALFGEDNRAPKSRSKKVAETVSSKGEDAI